MNVKTKQNQTWQKDPEISSLYDSKLCISLAMKIFCYHCTSLVVFQQNSTHTMKYFQLTESLMIQWMMTQMLNQSLIY